MCNEDTATYWTGGGGDSQNKENVGLSGSAHGEQVGDDNAEPCGPTENRIYFPLEKTLRNLRLLDLKLKYNGRQATDGKKTSEDSSESGSSSDESDSKAPGQSGTEEQEDTKQAHNAALIALLSQCHLKLQQLEDIKRYSGQLARSLWEAQVTVSYLKESAAELHHANIQKDNEIYRLSRELAESQRLLYEKSERIADMEAIFSSLGDHLRNRLSKQTFKAICQKKNHYQGYSENSKLTDVLLMAPALTDPSLAEPARADIALPELSNSRVCNIL
ncbi:uncharacterized protein RCH25_006723 [Pelodytes ibericus]